MLSDPSAVGDARRSPGRVSRLPSRASGRLTWATLRPPTDAHPGPAPRALRRGMLFRRDARPALRSSPALRPGPLDRADAVPVEPLHEDRHDDRHRPARPARSHDDRRPDAVGPHRLGCPAAVLRLGDDRAVRRLLHLGGVVATFTDDLDPASFTRAAGRLHAAGYAAGARRRRPVVAREGHRTRRSCRGTCRPRTIRTRPRPSSRPRRRAGDAAAAEDALRLRPHRRGHDAAGRSRSCRAPDTFALAHGHRGGRATARASAPALPVVQARDGHRSVPRRARHRVHDRDRPRHACSRSRSDRRAAAGADAVGHPGRQRDGRRATATTACASQGNFPAPGLPRRASPTASGTSAPTACRRSWTRRASQFFLAFSDATYSGPRPVAIFQHGLGSDKDSTWGTAQRLASLGRRRHRHRRAGARLARDAAVPAGADGSGERRRRTSSASTCSNGALRHRHRARQLPPDGVRPARDAALHPDAGHARRPAPRRAGRQAGPRPDAGHLPRAVVRLGHGGDVQRRWRRRSSAAVWNVGGAGLAMLFEDSGLFSLLAKSLEPPGRPKGELARFFSIIQGIVDPGDAANYAPYVTPEGAAGRAGVEAEGRAHRGGHRRHDRAQQLGRAVRARGGARAGAAGRGAHRRAAVTSRPPLPATCRAARRAASTSSTEADGDAHAAREPHLHERRDERSTQFFASALAGGHATVINPFAE